MKCPVCDTQLPDSNKFCNVCGTPITAQAPAVPVAPQPVQAPEQPVYQPYEQPVYQPYEQPVYQPPVVTAPPTVIHQTLVADRNLAPVTTIGQYIGWSFVTMIPLIGFIMMIVWAIDSSNMNRANYFRAIWVVFLITILLVVLPFFLLGGAAVLNDIM